MEDEVELGANVCVDRATLGETRIGRGTKVDNLVQIAHNCQIGERVIIAGQAGVAGSTRIEDDSVLLGQAWRAFELWLERPAPIDVMREALARELENHDD